MCGIVGYVGGRPVRDVLLDGLARLEYRGYDSAGISVLAGDRIDASRTVGKVEALRAKVQAGQEAGGAVALAERPATTGIGHTRWATHGRVSEENAHPHFDGENRVHVVVNGIVENYIELKDELTAAGCPFTSETDAEVIAHLIGRLNDGDLVAAVRAAFARLDGHFAFVAMSADEPDLLVGARRQCPLVVGLGEDENIIASDVPAFLSYTRRVLYLEDGEIVALRRDGVELTKVDGTAVERAPVTVDWDAERAEKAGYETFMLKEINEQADALSDAIADRTALGDRVTLGEEGAFDERLLSGVERVVIVACGTSYHAGLVGRYAIEGWARIPVEVDIASEYRYRDPVVGPGDLVLGITQSGETADTLAAMRLAAERGARVVAVTNVMGSQATRDAVGVLFTRAGLEIGVAATKTFLCQVAVMYLLALRLADETGALSDERRAELVGELKHLPHVLHELLQGVQDAVEPVAESCWQSDFFLYIGRHIGLPAALEGALKLKEISYIATDAYAAGEMKHGPIALLDESTPVVAVATDSPVLGKVISNLEEVKARGARVIAVAAADARIGRVADAVIAVPDVDWMLQPLLAVVPLQVLAYKIARRRGLDVDQPRNLAKTVTVE
ncbi:MAG TPA: glutamine--fructose-6-phosphate transaminase (isomerizing) [Solirubrobacteraceae bacterium]|nr:glutamine--fructose-6-phosphate transaminase (isomerizing) [Solirubrobacteraceae bacterium]